MIIFSSSQHIALSFHSLHTSIHPSTWQNIKRCVLTDCPGSYAAHVVLQRLVQLGENKIHSSSGHFSPDLFLCAFPSPPLLLLHSVSLTVLLSSVCETQRGCVRVSTVSLPLSLPPYRRHTLRFPVSPWHVHICTNICVAHERVV